MTVSPLSCSRVTTHCIRWVPSSYNSALPLRSVWGRCSTARILPPYLSPNFSNLALLPDCMADIGIELLMSSCSWCCWWRHLDGAGEHLQDEAEALVLVGNGPGLGPRHRVTALDGVECRLDVGQFVAGVAGGPQATRGALRAPLP